MGRLQALRVSLVQRPWRLASLVVALPALALAATQLRAWYHFRAGRTAVASRRTTPVPVSNTASFGVTSK